jgi:hypothetical protein
MSRSSVTRSLATSRFTNVLLSRPRLTISLLLLAVLIAVQGGAVAGDGLEVGTSVSGTQDPGP